MSQDPFAHRRFTDREVSAILRRAAELQAQEEDTPGGEGTSLAQLQQAVAELGIKPHLVAKAAADIAGGKQPQATSFFWGSPPKIEVERLVGYQITEESWPAILEEMRRVTGRVGDSRAIGRTWEWISSSEDLLHVTVSPQGKHSRVTVTARFGELGVMTYVFAGMSAFITGLALTSTHHQWPVTVDLAVFGGLFTAAFGTARTLYQAIGNSRRRRVKALLSVLENRPEQAETKLPQVASYQTDPDRESQPAQQVVGIVDRP